MLEDVLQNLAAVAQAEIVQQRLHDGGMAGIADRAVVQRPHAAFQRFAQRAEPARGVEGFIGHAVERKLFALLHRRDMGQPAFDDRLAGLDIFVDNPVRAPGQIVVERVGGILRQRADPHAHAVERLEPGRKVAGDDGDEARRQTALGDEGGRGAALGGLGSQSLHAPGRFHILGQVEIMDAGARGTFGNRSRQVEGGCGQNGKGAGQQSVERLRIGDIDRMQAECRVRLHGCQLRGAAVGQLDAVIAAMGQQSGNGGPDFPGSDDDDVLHEFPSG